MSTEMQLAGSSLLMIVNVRSARRGSVCLRSQAIYRFSGTFAVSAAGRDIHTNPILLDRFGNSAQFFERLCEFKSRSRVSRIELEGFVEARFRSSIVATVIIQLAYFATGCSLAFLRQWALRLLWRRAP